jgi:hypothetical protein
MAKQILEICVDFDGTCTTHEFPHIGKPIGAERVLKRLVEEGHKLILFTMRSDSDFDPKFVNAGPNIDGSKAGKYLSDAIQWFEEREIPLYGIQTNPTQHTWTSSPKAYGQIYIDDAALGCPLAHIPSLSSRPFVDWQKVEIMLEELGVLTPNLKVASITLEK